MPNPVRVMDLMTGHGCYPPNPIITGSPSVNVNGRALVRVGDMTEPHLCLPLEKPHHAYIRNDDKLSRVVFSDSELGTKLDHTHKYNVYDENGDVVGIEYRKCTLPAYIKFKLEYATITPDNELVDPPRHLKDGEKSFCDEEIMTASTNVYFQEKSK